MGALLITLIAVFIFGGGYFLITLARFAVSELVARIQYRRYCRHIANQAYAGFIEHI